MKRSVSICLFIVSAGIVLALLSSGVRASGADSSPQVQFSAKDAGPRIVEDLTQKALIRDYALGWRNLADAFDSASATPLDGNFVDTARSDLGEAIAGEARSGLRSRYSEQHHDVQVVFYAPEGDGIELHDTMQCQLQIVDGAKVIHEEQLKMHYVVLMTPAADRWVIRQFQAVPQF
jgi:hypothetical protein